MLWLFKIVNERSYLYSEEPDQLKQYEDTPALQRQYWEVGYHMLSISPSFFQTSSSKILSKIHGERENFCATKEELDLRTHGF